MESKKRIHTKEGRAKATKGRKEGKKATTRG
jgi:hypothetical protein